LAEKKWVVRDGRPRCRNCSSLLHPVDEPTGLKCDNCGSMYPLSDEELAELTFDLSD
jgi:DNA-directed RNA polymerase subunit M/transcription elongation factor TFIIS